MPDDFGTLSMRRGDRTREIEILRQHYGRHRDALARLVPDAPTEHLAMEYQRLIGEIDAALRKLDEMEGRSPTAPGISTDTNPSFKTPTVPGTTAPGTRPLMRTQETPASTSMYEPTVGAAPQSRLMLIVVAGVVVLGLLMWLIWRASSDRKGPTPIVEQRPAVTASAPPPPSLPPPRPPPPQGGAGLGGLRDDPQGDARCPSVRNHEHDRSARADPGDPVSVPMPLL